MRSPKRIGIVSPWASRSGGGVFEAVVTHCALMRKLGHQPIVFAISDKFSTADRYRFGDTEVITVPRIGPRMIGYAPAMLRHLESASLDIVHLHGIWMYPSAVASRWALRTGRPFIISPHGMLDPWILSRGKIKKYIAELAYERMSWRSATAFHALTDSEAEDISRATGRRSVFVVPNTVPENALQTDCRRDFVYLGRIHPKKNIPNLIKAWCAARDDCPFFAGDLIIAGWGSDDYVNSIIDMVNEAGRKDIKFIGPVFGAEKEVLLGSARYLLLPSFSEGLPIAILEAWASGTPTLMSQHCHLSEGYAEGAAIDCGTDIATISSTLQLAFSHSQSDWEEMHKAAKRIAKRRFAGSVIADQWNDIYSKVSNTTVGKS